MTAATPFPIRPWGSPQEIANHYGLHIDTVLRLLRQGLMQGYQPSGVNGRWRIHVDDADAWVRNGAPTQRRRSGRKTRTGHP